MTRRRRAIFGPRALALSLVAAAVSACGPVQYVTQVSNRSADALMEAQLAEADRYALYEYTKAAAYQDKAREEAAEASWELSLDYGRRAEEFAQRARALARQRAQRRADQPGPGATPAPASAPGAPAREP